MTVRDWAARTQGVADWADAIRRDDPWLGARIGLIVGSMIVLPIFALFLLFVVTR